MSNKKYVYDVKMANYLIQNGVRCIETGIHRVTKKTFWAFDYYESLPLLEIWKARANSLKKQ